jgi:hypothetical protein
MNGTDAMGFFVQAGTVGLFVEANPATLNPPAQPGDVVSFIVTRVGVTGSVRKALSITGWSRSATGGSLLALTRPVNGIDFGAPAMQSLYENSLVSLTGSVLGWNGDGGTAYGEVQLVGTSTTVRLPQAMNDTEDFRAGCTIAVSAGPLWLGGDGGTGQVHTWDAGRLAGSVCPPPVLLTTSADAGTTSGAALSFSRALSWPTVSPALSLVSLSTGLPSVVVPTQLGRERFAINGLVSADEYQLSIAPTLTDTRGRRFDGGVLEFTAGGCTGEALVISAFTPVTANGEFVELHNRSAQAMSLSTTSLSVNGTLASLASLGTLAPGQFALVRLASTVGVPAADLTLTSNPAGGGGFLALTTGPIGSCTSATGDRVAWGNTTAGCAEGTALPGLTGAPPRYRRDVSRGCVDGNSNGTDFVSTTTMTPRNKSSPPVICTCP